MKSEARREKAVFPGHVLAAVMTCQMPSTLLNTSRVESQSALPTPGGRCYFSRGKHISEMLGKTGQGHGASQCQPQPGDLGPKQEAAIWTTLTSSWNFLGGRQGPQKRWPLRWQAGRAVSGGELGCLLRHPSQKGFADTQTHVSPPGRQKDRRPCRAFFPPVGTQGSLVLTGDCFTHKLDLYKLRNTQLLLKCECQGASPFPW